MSAELLVGNWKLVSWQVVTEDGAKDLFGPKPNGHFIVTREGRAMTVTTAEGRTPGETDAERAALHKSMLA
jgi:Lipocalin-like domain